MAANGFNLTAQINLRGPSNVGVIVSDIKKQIGSINANLNVTISANAAKNVTQLNSGLQTLNQTFKSVQTSATSAAAAIAQFNAAVGNIQISSYQNNINSSITATQKLGQSQTQTAKALSISASEMEEFGKQAGLAVRRFAAFSAVTSVIFSVTNSISKGVSAFIDFDKELVRLQQVTGESASGLNFLQNTITSLATNLGVGSAELLNVSSTLAQAGLSARDTEKALKALALSSLAPSFDSMNETVEGSIALMRQFGIGAGDLTKALGSVNAVAARFAVEASDIISAIQRTGGVFASASKGVSEGTEALNEFIAVFTSVRATTRESAETIATGLRTIFTRVQREGTIDALKEYGVNLTDLDGKFVGAYKAVELLSKGLNSIDPRDLKFSRIVEELGGFRQIGKVIPLIQEFGTAQQALSVAQSGQNSLTTDAVKAQLSLANQISKVREEFLALFREIGASNTFQNMATGALQVVRAIVKVADAVKGILPVLAVLGISKGLDSLIKFGSGLYTGIRKGPDNKSGGFAQGGPVSYFATGGLVPGSGNSDSVNARLTPGEFVMRKSAVSSIGAENLKNMNQGGLAAAQQSQVKRINKYAGGNIVTQIGGVPATTTVVKGKDNTNVGFENDYYNINADKKIIKIAYNKKDKKFRADKKLIDVSDVNNLIYNNPKSFETWENIVAQVLGATKLNEQDPNYPIDLIKGKKLYDAKFRPESGFKEKDAALKALSHRLEQTNSGFRYNQSNKTIKLSKFLGKSTRPERDDFQDPGSITYVYPEFKDIPTNLASIEEGMRTRRSQAQNLPDEGAGYFARKAVSVIGDSKYISGNKDIINLISMPKKNKSNGGLIQKFDVGGEAKAIRRIGIIDSDVLRDKTNADKVSEGMKELGTSSATDYALQLGKIAAQARKTDNLKRFRAIAGAAASGKSSLATGVGANDDATLRQTIRSHILTPQDINNVDEVIAITSTVGDAKLDAYLRDTDRTYTVSSSTKKEQDLVRKNKTDRDTNLRPTLYGREPGTAMTASLDFANEEATLIDELGSKNVVLGRKTDTQGNLTNRFRRKRGDELPEIVQAGGFYTGGFAPPTRGHRGAFEQLLEKMVAKNPDATVQDIVVSVAPNLPMVEGKEGLAHAARYGIFDADLRSLLADINFKGAMISQDGQSTPGILPKLMEVPGKNNRRKFARLKGAMAITSGKEEGVLGKYERAGIQVTDIPRIEDISATIVRELLFNKNYAELDKIVNPEIGAILKGNQPQLKNRSVMVPALLEEINEAAKLNTGLINQQVEGVLSSAPGGPYKNVSKKLKEEHPEIASQVELMRKQRDSFKRFLVGAQAHSIIRELASSYPEVYGIDPSRRVATTAGNISAEDAKSHIGDRVKSLLPEETKTADSSLLESIKQNVVKQLAAPKGSGTLPTDSKTITRAFLNAPIPPDPAFGMFAGKTVDPSIVKKVWRQTYPGLSEDKTASYIAVKEWLETKYNASTGAKTEALSQAIKESTMVGLVGMLPIGHERLSGPFTWMLGKNAAGEDISVTASILERGLGKKYEEEIKAAQRHAEQGSELLASGLASKSKKGPTPLRSLSKDQLETLGQGNIEGAYIEQALARLWANLDNVSTRTRPIDYPDGLGESAELFPGISPTMPTEVKRTINSDSRSDAIEEFQRYFRLINGVPEPEAKKEAIKALAAGGEVQKFMAGGVATKTRKPKEVFGTGEIQFPSRIAKSYAEEQHSVSESLRAKLAWDKYPKDERIMIDDSKVQESFQQTFDRERFASSFKEKISRDSLFERMSDFAKFVGLPQEDLTTALPLQLDFGASKRGGGLSVFAAAQFERGAAGVRPYEGYDLSKFGYGEKQKQEAYGLQKLITAKEKEIKKITKTPTETFDDGSFSFDSEAYSKANDELRDLKNRSFKLSNLKSEAERAALAEQNTVSSTTGRGTISFAPSMGYASNTPNSTLYHEMTHQLFQGLRTKSADSFDKYRERVSSLFSGDNDDLADAFDSLTAGGGYSSADVVYGRSYKSNALSQAISSYYRQNLDFSRSVTPVSADITKNLATLSNQSTTAKRAREYRPINPKVNEALLQVDDKFGITQERINRMEDSGKEEFLTTLIEKAPQLDQNLQGILDSTLTELLAGAGIQRQKYAIGGKVSRKVPFESGVAASPFDSIVSKKLGPEVYDLQKNSGLTNFEFEDAKRFADAAQYNFEEFKKLLAQRVEAKKQRSQIKINPSDIAKQLMPETKPLRPDLRALADSLQDKSNDIGYRPSVLERIAQARTDINNARGFAVGGVAEPEQKKEKSYGKIGLSIDSGRITASYMPQGMDLLRGASLRSGEVTADKLQELSSNLYAVQSAGATKGYGPKLYDVVMEAATSQGAMLTSDRHSVSSDAYGVWNYYFKNRGDVKKTPLPPQDWYHGQKWFDPAKFPSEDPKTWAPYSDDAWTLLMGYSKAPESINDPKLVQKLAGGGGAGYVPAMVSNGEAFVPPETARSIGYGKLAAMNQADRNGMTSFASGGISVFKGPGHGTSDSIGPIALPVGSFVIREAATKALGLSSGGSVGVQKFATGGTAIDYIVSRKEEKETKTAELDTLKKQASTATGSARVLLESKIKAVEKTLEDLDKDIETASKEFTDLSKTVDAATTKQKERQDALSTAQTTLVDKLKGYSFGGTKFEDLNDSQKQQVIEKAQKGDYTTSTGKDRFETENKAVKKAQAKLDTANRVKENAETDRSAKFGNAKTTQDVKNRSLTSTELQDKRQQDEKFFEYKGRKEGTTAASYKYGLAKQLGQSVYQIQDKDQYAGKKQEMAYDLSTRKNKLSGLSSTIEEAKNTAKTAVAGSPEAEAAKTRLADATSRLDAEVEAIAKSMRDLNPTLENVDENARAVANALAAGDLDAAQKKMIESLGDVPEEAEAMKIAMQRMADQLGVDVGTLEREFGSGAGAKTLERQKFIASREGQRFGVMAEIAPDLAKRFSESRAGKFGGNVSDFISGKGGAYSQAFAKMGGMTALNMGIAAAPGLVQKAMGDPTSSQGAATYAGAQGAASTLGAGLQFAAKTGPFAPFVAAGAAVAALATAFKDGRNAFIEFEKNLRSQNIQRALEGTASGFEALARDAKDLAAQRQVSEKLVTAGKEAAASTNIDQTIPKAFFVNLFDSMGGGKDSADRSKILEKYGTSSYLSTTSVGTGFGLFGNADQNRRALTSSMIPEQAQANAKQYSEIATQSKQLIEVKGRSGQTFSDVKASPEYASLAKNIALANVAVQEQILAIDNSTSYRTAADREAAKEAIIRAHADKEISKMMLASDRAKAAADLEKTSRSFTMSFKRLFENMEASVNRTNAELAKFNNALDSNVAAMTGSGKNSTNTELESLEVLKNPRAYSQDRVDSANNRAGSIFGFDSQIVSGLSGLGEKLETSLLSSINSTISKNPGASDTKIAIDLEKSIGDQVSGLSLPKDLSQQLTKEIASAVGDLRKEGTKKIDIDQLTDRIPGLKNAIDSAKNAQNASVAALQNWQNNLNNYSEALNRAADMEMQAADLRRKANDIAIEGAMSLGQALGKNYGADIGTKLRDQKVGGMTGGLTSPTDIRNRMDDLNSQRQRQEAEVKLSKNESVGGNKNAIQNVINNEKALKQTNNQLRQTSAALKVLAESGSAASAALNAIQEAQRKQQGKVGLIEKLVTSGPEELFNFNKSLNSLQRMSAGQVVPQTAEERRDTLSTLNDITPLLGDSKQANNIKANVLESMLKDSGVGVSTQFKEILNALRNPESDNETQQAIKVYQQAIDVQTQANEMLAQINSELANDIANTTAEAIKNALTGITISFNKEQLDDIAKGVRVPATVAEPKALGGLIYAAAGTMVDFKPQGTDTVPAMLTPGEFVVNRTATANNLGLLHSINSGKTKYYADGGYVSNIEKDDFKKSDTKATKNMYPDIGNVGSTTTPFQAYSSVQALPSFSGKTREPLSKLSGGNVYSYIKGTSISLEPSSYILGGAQPPAIMAELGPIIGATSGQLYRGGAVTTAPPSIGRSSFSGYIDADSGDADKISSDKKFRIEGEDKFAEYRDKLLALNAKVPGSIEFSNDSFDIDGQTVYYPSQNNIDKYGRGLKPTATVVSGGVYSRLVLKNLAANIDSGTSFGPFFAPELLSTNNQKVADYYVEGNLYKELVASSISDTKSKQSSFGKYLGMDPIQIDGGAGDRSPELSKTYIEKLALITKRIREAIKNIDKDSATHETDHNMKVKEFSNHLASLYNGTERAQVFNKSDLLDIDKFTSADTITVYGTSFPNWNDKYVKDIENSIAHTDKFRDLEFYKEGVGKDPVEIKPDGAAGGVVKKFGWIGGGDFEFSESAQKAMNAEVQQNKDKIGGVGSSQPPSKGNVLLTTPNVNLPYNLSYLEYSNSAGIAGAARIAANEKVYWVQSPEDDLSVFKNLKEIPSKLFVKQDGMKKNLPIDQVAAQLNRDKAVNDYFDALKKYGISDPRTVALEGGINDKTVEIGGTFLKPNTPGDITNFKEAYNGAATIRIGDYLKASAKAISSKLTKESKDQAKKKMKNSTNDAESLEDNQYHGAALAMILGAQDLFSAGGQFELPDILGNGWFHPTIDSQYKSIYDVDLGTLRAYMGQLSQVFDGKVQRINQVMSRIPDSYRDQAVAGLTNLYGATKAFQAISNGDTSSLMGVFSKTHFQNQTPQGDPAMNRKAVELFQSLGMGVRMGGVGTEQFTKDQTRQREKDLKGVKINNEGSSSNETKEISPESLPKNYQDLFYLAINPYNEFPNRDSRKGLIQEFIDAVPTARDPATNSLLFGPQTGAIFGTALTKLQSWYGGERAGWLGTDYLTEQGTADVTDPASNEPKSYDTRIKELEAVRNDALYQDASAGYIHIGGKQKFNTDLPDFDYYKNKEPLYKQTGGMIYASQGTLVNFEPRGTDTVPAMLTPGEFVINRRATQEHLPLLQAINNGGIKGFNEGGVVYLAGGGMAQRQTKEERQAQFQQRKQARDQQLAQAKEQRNEYNRQRKAGLEAQREAMSYRNRLLREGRSVDEANQMAGSYAQEAFQNNYQKIKDQERAKFEELEQRKAEIQEDKERAADPTLRTQDLLARYEGRLTDVETARVADTIKGPYPELETKSDKTSITKGPRYANRPSGDRFRDSLSDKDKELLDRALKNKNRERISTEIDEKSVAQSTEADKKARQQAETEAKTAGNIETARTGRSFSLTDNTGKFSTTGTVISRNDQGVSVKKDNGKVIFVPFNRLNSDTIKAVNAQWAYVEAKRDKEMEEASRSNFANMEFMAKEQERSKKLQEAGIKDTSTEIDILRRKRDSGIDLTKDEISRIQQEDQDRDNLVKSRAKAASVMKEEKEKEAESAKRKTRIAEEKERLARRDQVFSETREKLAGIVRQEAATIAQLKKDREDSGWFGSLSRGVTGVDNYELQIQAAENKLASARLGLDSLGDTSATESRRGGSYAGGPSSAAEFNRGSDWDPGRALDTARGLAGLPHVDSTSYKLKDAEPVTNRGLYRTDFADTSEKSSTKTITSSKDKNILGIDTTRLGIGFNTTYTSQSSLYKAEDDALRATRDISLDVITSVGGLGVGGAAGAQVAKAGTKTLLQKAATIAPRIIPAGVNALSSGAKAFDDVRSGEKTATQAVVDVGIETAVGGLLTVGGSQLGSAARRASDKAGERFVARVTSMSPSSQRKVESLVSQGYKPYDAASMVMEAREDAIGDVGARKFASWLGIRPNDLPPTSQSLGTLGTPTGNGGVRLVGKAPDAVAPGTPQVTLPVTPATPAPLTDLTLAPTFNKPAVPSTFGQTSPAYGNVSYDEFLERAALIRDPGVALRNKIPATAVSQSAAAAAPSATNTTTAAATGNVTGNWWSRNMPNADGAIKGIVSRGSKLYGKGKEFVGGKIGGFLKNTTKGLTGAGSAAYGIDKAMEFFSEEEPQKKASGGIVYASNGALIAAKQVGSDSVPAMLTPGEFVVNRQSAQRFMPVLNAINSGHYSHGGTVKYLANGGIVQPKYLKDAGMVNSNITNMSSQSGVLTSTSANQSQPVMAKPAWVDEFASRLEQSGAIFNQGASRVVEGANTISSAGQDIANANPQLTVGGNVNLANANQIIEQSLAGMMPIAQSAGQMGREGARQDSQRQWRERTGDA